MIHGYAYLVEHPRRREQDYVSLDPAYVGHDILQSVRDCDWPIKVTLIGFRGVGALPLYLSGDDLFDRVFVTIDDSAHNWLVVEGSGSKKAIVPNPARRNAR